MSLTVCGNVETDSMDRMAPTSRSTSVELSIMGISVSDKSCRTKVDRQMRRKLAKEVTDQKVGGQSVECLHLLRMILEVLLEARLEEDLRWN